MPVTSRLLKIHWPWIWVKLKVTGNYLEHPAMMRFQFLYVEDRNYPPFFELSKNLYLIVHTIGLKGVDCIKNKPLHFASVAMINHTNDLNKFLRKVLSD